MGSVKFHSVTPLTMRGSTHTLFLAVLTSSSFAISHAADSLEAREESKSLEDPTVLKPRVWSDTEWNKFRDGSNDLEETLGTLWAWPLSSKQDLGIRLKIPYELHFAGDSPGDSDTHGIGDIQAAVGTAFQLRDTLRVGGGLELRTPSGSVDRLSDNTWRIQEFGAVAWDAQPWLTLSPSFEYNQSLAEEQGVLPRHFIELFFPVTVTLPGLWSVAARYELKIDFQDHNYLTHSARLAVSKHLFESIPLNLTFTFKKPFDTAVHDFQVNCILTYFFVSRKSSGLEPVKPHR